MGALETYNKMEFGFHDAYLNQHLWKNKVVSEVIRIIQLQYWPNKTMENSEGNAQILIFHLTHQQDLGYSKEGRTLGKAAL